MFKMAGVKVRLWLQERLGCEAWEYGDGGRDIRQRGPDMLKADWACSGGHGHHARLSLSLKRRHGRGDEQ